MTPVTVSVRQATELVGLGRSSLYRLMEEGRLRSTTVYGKRLIYVDSLLFLVGIENASNGGHKSEAVSLSTAPISKKLNPICAPDNPKASVPTTFPTTKWSDIGGQTRTHTVKKRPKIKANAERARQLRTFAKGL